MREKLLRNVIQKTGVSFFIHSQKFVDDTLPAYPTKFHQEDMRKFFEKSRFHGGRKQQCYVEFDIREGVNVFFLFVNTRV